jgi:integrase
LNEIFIELKAAGKVDYTSPSKMREKEITALLIYMRVREFEPSTQDKYLDYLNRLLLWSNNTILVHLRQSKKGLLPREVPKEIAVIPPLTLQGIKEAAARIKNRWNRNVACFVVQLYSSTGLRPSELRRAKLMDVDTTNWIIHVSNPKGKGRYTMGRSVMIIPSIREAVWTYLTERDKYLRKHHQPAAEPLIPYCPYWRPHKARYFHQAEWSNLKGEIQEKAGLRFKWKDFRSTFAQVCIDNGAKVESVSRLLGHSSTKTTEAYYGRIRNDKAMEEVALALEKRPIPIPLEISK